MHRIATWLIVIWTGFMAIGILAAFTGIGGDCAGLRGAEFAACQGDAWARGSVGLMLLVFLWFVVAAPLWALYTHTRSKENVVVFGPAGQQVLLSESEAAQRVAQPGWSYVQSMPVEARNPTA